MTEIVSIREQYQEPDNGNYKYIRFADCSLDISKEGNANIVASMKTLGEVDKVNISVYLQRYDGDWTTIKNWETECIGSFCSLFKEKEVVIGYRYRVETYYSAYKGAYSEWLVASDGD